MKKTCSPIDLYSKTVNSFMLGGGKNVMKSVIDAVFDKLASSFLCSLDNLLFIIFNSLKAYIEIKKLKRGRRTFLVPLPTKRRRRVHLALSWIFTAIQDSKLKISFEEKLYLELKKIVLKQSCLSLDCLQKNNKFVKANKANLHYRW